MPIPLPVVVLILHADPVTRLLAAGSYACHLKHACRVGANDRNMHFVLCSNFSIDDRISLVDKHSFSQEIADKNIFVFKNQHRPSQVIII